MNLETITNGEFIFSPIYLVGAVVLFFVVIFIVVQLTAPKTTKS